MSGQAVHFSGDLVKLSREAVNGLAAELTAAEGALGGLSDTQAQLIALARGVIQQLGDEFEALQRQQEIVADIGWNMGYKWRDFDLQSREAVMDHLEGSRGLMDKCVAWAKEFDVIWEAKDKDKQEDYIGDVDDFAHGKLAALVAEIRLGA